MNATIPTLAFVAVTALLPAQVVINELHYRPRSDLQEDEYLELHNAGSEPASLDGWSFTDGIDFTFPAGTTMAPGAYLVLARDPDLSLPPHQRFRSLLVDPDTPGAIQ